MKILKKMFWVEEFTYVSPKNPEELKNYIESVCQKQKEINLTGKFISESEFELIPRWQFINIRNFERDLSFLNGKIYKDQLDRTKVNFSVRPNSIFVIFFFLFPIIAIAFSFCDPQPDNFLLILIFGIIVPLICLTIAQISKNLIKDRFVKTFNLNAVEKN